MILFKNWRTRLYNHKNYHFFNLLIFIAMVVLYVYVKLGLTIIKCPYAAIGVPCKTCGLTTDFKNLLHGDFYTIRLGNLLLFLLLMSQLLIRPLISIILFFTKKSKLIKYMDIIITILLTIITYIKLIG